MFTHVRSALRVYRSSFTGSFLVVVLAAALLSATGVWMESGLRGDASGQAVPLLTSIASSFAGTTLLMVVLVVSSTFSSALRQRHAQFALLRAVGATTGQVRAMVTTEVLAVTAIAAPLGAVPGLFAANLLTPLLEAAGIVPAGFTLTLTPLPILASLLLLLPTGLLAARLAARKTTRISPVAAVRGSAVESPALSRGRRMSAIVLLAAGILVAATPAVLPGTLGSATAATSAFLLIIAAALAGPGIVGWAAARGARATGSGPGGTAVLAWANTRGFSHRLTAAIIPLALVLSLGTVQTGVDQGVVKAAGQQLRSGLNADLVLAPPAGPATPDNDVAAVPGVDAVMASSLVPVSTKVEDDDEVLALFNDLLWESTAVRTVADDATRFIDADVSDGSLAALEAPGTIAVGRDALLGTGKGIGDTIGVRFGDGTETTLSIAAVYERGLAFGDFIVNERTLPPAERPRQMDAVFVQTSPADAASTAATMTALGWVSTDVTGYADSVAAAAASQQRLSGVLLLVLVLFIVLAAANSLVMLTGARRPEFELLARVGATRHQLRRVVALESVFVAVAALVIGSVSVIPALFGVGFGMLGQFVPAVDWPAYGALVLVVVVTSVGTMGASAWFSTRVRA